MRIKAIIYSAIIFVQRNVVKSYSIRNYLWESFYFAKLLLFRQIFVILQSEIKRLIVDKQNKHILERNISQHLYFIFIIIFLGMLSAFGPFITDMYLPTLPSMKDVFHTSESMVQLGLTASMIGLAFGQLFFGPISEKYGRKPVLIWAMIVFSLAAFASIFSPTIEFFLVCRLFQGIGGSGGIVLSRSISTDSYTGRELVKMMAIIGAVHGIAPVAAPVIGGLVSDSVGWKGIFVILLVLGICLLAMCLVYNETLPVEKRLKGSLWTTFKGFKVVLRIKAFVYPLMAFACTYGILFGYISSSPFLIQNHFGFSEIEFSLIFAVNAIAIGIGSTLAAKFKTLYSSLIIGSALALSFSVIQLLFALFLDNFWAYEITIWFTLVSVGMIFTSGSTMAMEAGRANIGTASATVGSIGFLIGGFVSPIVGLGNALTTCGIVFVVSASLVFWFSWNVCSKMKGQEHI